MHKLQLVAIKTWLIPPRISESSTIAHLLGCHLTYRLSCQKCCTENDPFVIVDCKRIIL